MWCLCACVGWVDEGVGGQGDPTLAATSDLPQHRQVTHHTTPHHGNRNTRHTLNLRWSFARTERSMCVPAWDVVSGLWTRRLAGGGCVARPSFSWSTAQVPHTNNTEQNNDEIYMYREPSKLVQSIMMWELQSQAQYNTEVQGVIDRLWG